MDEIIVIQKINRAWSSVYVVTYPSVYEACGWLIFEMEALHKLFKLTFDEATYKSIIEALHRDNIVLATQLFNNLKHIKGKASIPYMFTIMRVDLTNNKVLMVDGIELNGNSSAKKEIECRVCKKMNDVGVSECWNCGNHP